MATFLEVLNDLIAGEKPVVSVTVVDTSGSAPQDRGAKMIVTAEGRQYGTVGGGKVEAKALAEAQKMLAGEVDTATRFVQWNLSRDVGMTCGGIVRLYFESWNAARWDVVVFGAGHVAQALVTLLSSLDCHITCIDPRDEWLRRLPESPKVHAVHADDMRSLVNGIPENAFVVLMTMGHATDLPILTEILRSRTFPYLGVIGSHSKAIVLRRDLAAAGLPESAQNAFHCPVGLDIGSNHPFEIAISIVAQMLQRRDGLGAQLPRGRVAP